MAARHSWIFTYVLNGIVPGDVSLRVHGKTVVEDGATIFDGVTSWLGASLHSTDCLLAPANCKDGLSLGFKIKFAGLVKFPEERYIVDTGVLSKGTRGIAIYLQDGQLFCVVMTMTAQWKVCTNDSYNKSSLCSNEVKFCIAIFKQLVADNTMIQ